MRIVIDARMMGPGTTRGIGRYIEELVRALLAESAEDQFVLIVRHPNHPFGGHPSVETVVADLPWYGFAEQLRMPSVLRSCRPDIVFFPHWNVPIFYSGSYVVTIHDLLLRHEPASANASTRGWMIRTAKRWGYRLVLGQALRRARRIFVPTESVAADLRRFYPSVSSKVMVTGEGMPQPITDAELRPSAVPPYLLYVGSAYPHKGLETLLDAWPRMVAAFPNLELRFVGPIDAFMKRLQDRVIRALLPHITFLGKISDEELAVQYREAWAFVFPSRIEGFGLPPLEALANGCPVLASDIPVLREVLGNEGVWFFRPGDPDAILRAVSHLAEDQIGARTRAMRGARLLAERHRWRVAAARTLEALRHA